MAETEADVVKIRITVSDTAATVKDVSKISESLIKLSNTAKEATKGLSGKAIGKEFTRLASAASALGQAVQSIRGFASALRSISRTADTFDPSSAIEGIEALARAIQWNFSPGQLQLMRDFADAFRGMQAIAGATATPTADDGAVSGLTEQTDALGRAWEKVKRVGRGALSAIAKGAKAAGVAVAYVAKAPFSALGKAITNAKAKVSNFFAMFKKRLMYRAINGIISAITNGIKEGVNNVYQYSKTFGGTFSKSMDRAATSLLYFKNSLGAMVAPLINMLVPALEWVIQKVVTFVNTLNRLFAMLSGAKTWTQALMYPKEYAEATDKANKAAKKWKATILGIDELNLMADNRDNGHGNSGDSMDYSKMFQEVALTGSNMFGDFFKPFAAAWKNEGMNTINAIKSAIQSIIGMFAAVGQTFAQVWQNGTGQETLEHILRIIQGIAGFVGGLASSFTIAWQANDNGLRIVQALWDIFNSILGTIEGITLATANWAANLDLSPLLESIGLFFETLKPIVDSIGELFTWLWNDILLPLSTWTLEDAAPASIDALRAAFDALGALVEPLIKGLKKSWEDLKPVFELVGKIIITIINELKKVFEKLAETFKSKGDKITNIMVKIGDIIQTIMPILTLIFEVFKNKVETIMEFVGDIVAAVVGFIIDQFDALIEMLHGVIEFIAGVFSGDWERALNGLKEIFQGWWNGIKSVINVVIGGVEAVVNAVVKVINFFIRQLKKISFDFPDWVPFGLGGHHFGITISELAEVQIPRLASGGAVDMGTMFIAGEAGPEIVAGLGNGQSGVMNIGQMEDAVRAGMADASSAQNSILRQILALVANIDEKELTATVTTGDIREGLSRANRRDGWTVVPVG